MRRSLLLALGTVLFCAGRLPAQDSSALLVPGAHVRVWSAAMGYVSRDATFKSRTADSLFLTTQFRSGDGHWETETMRVAIAQLDSLNVEVRTKRRTHIGKGIGIGSLVGVVLGAASDPKHPLDGAAFPGLVFGVGFGFWVGLITGIGYTTNWVAVSLR